VAVSELPTGTVTFLFTDIEGSTQLLKQLRERYGDVRAEHERLLREAFEANGGQEIDTQGDSFFVAFRRARDAVAAAVAGQRALADHPWPEGAEVRVRIGVHTGEPLAAEGRYVGLGVHRAARISAAGHGGQVLLSNATRELVEDDLPSDVRLRDLGEHRLKDIDRPERLFQLEAGGLASEFPPLKTLERQPSEAPFAGREGELAEAAQAAVARPQLLRGRRALVLAAPAAVAVAAVISMLLVRGTDEASALRAVDANAVGVIDPGDNEIASEIAVDAAPGHMAAGLSALWVANADANTVSRIDLETNSVRQTIRVGSGPSAIAVGADAVWATNGLGRTVSRIDPETNEVVQTIDVGNGPAGVAVGEGAVWVANGNDASLSRIDPDSGDVVATIDVGGGASAVAVGFGAVWVANGTRASVSRVDPQANMVVQPVNVGNAPTALGVGFGSVWVANGADGTISRIDAESNVVTATIAVGESPSAIAVGDDAVWVADALAGKLVRIDPGRNDVERRLDIGNRPEGVAVVADSVYVAVRATGRAHRGGTLRVRVDFIDSIDPAIAYVPTSWSVLSLTSDGLTGYKRVGGNAGSQLVPDLATALPTATDGGRTYTFRLRRGIRYSTGIPVKAADFRRAIERSLTAGEEAPARLS
jgi:YVTN family beta-propeller protein